MAIRQMGLFQDRSLAVVFLVQLNIPGPGGVQASRAVRAAVPQSNSVGSIPGGPSMKITRPSFMGLINPDAIDPCISARSGS
jgi:hypothetical protein